MNRQRRQQYLPRRVPHVFKKSERCWSCRFRHLMPPGCLVSSWYLTCGWVSSRQPQKKNISGGLAAVQRAKRKAERGGRTPNL
ncbi:hypothetical protein BDW74DRAFT_148213, partial [Aspergillus multicolor]|uniref:uncharacterized protein n=1 Tax=Aspergillus multicolor TaxID=41759 RepID=UPI003CCDFEDD